MLFRIITPFDAATITTRDLGFIITSRRNTNSSHCVPIFCLRSDLIPKIANSTARSSIAQSSMYFVHFFKTSSRQGSKFARINSSYSQKHFLRLFCRALLRHFCRSSVRTPIAHVSDILFLFLWSQKFGGWHAELWLFFSQLRIRKRTI